MAKKNNNPTPVESIRHKNKRKNIPPEPVPIGPRKKPSGRAVDSR